jgi:phage major capsid protein|uniref:Major capsid protein n=1 Tax=Siphoviridae sp. ctZ1O5 TaxID=2825555 RepID=A0A8S5PEP5_9CAUD|nr:MAG TPA: major capsid protein [Siphoviridae sp. ctZ1O5]DAN54669.1 MAG TPA: major capsid protein [Caudoviricetes sp.]
MAVYQYAEQFTQFLAQKYEKELCSDALMHSNPQITFLNAQTIKLPRLTLSGYKDHTRTAGFNAGTISNDWEPKKLAHDRDIEFFVDPMDIDETNLALSVANIQNTFETEQAIPEKDCYNFSKLHTELTTFHGRIDSTTVLTAQNILAVFDEEMSKMDDAGVPVDGRILYVTPAVNKLLKEADGIQRMITVNSSNAVNRSIHGLDEVTVKMVPSGRMKTKYNFTNGCVVAADADQINFILVHPSCVVARDKYAYISLFTPGTDSRTADGYLYQNRNYWDLFMIERKVAGCAAHVTKH